jgi:PhnB protein
MKAVNPYLKFSDNCEEAFEFFKSVFGGEFVTVMRFKVEWIFTPLTDE